MFGVAKVMPPVFDKTPLYFGWSSNPRKACKVCWNEKPLFMIVLDNGRSIIELAPTYMRASSLSARLTHTPP